MPKVVDVGVDDAEKAQRNRERIKRKENTEYYKRLEAWLAHSPQQAILPDWVTTGNLPQITNRDWRESGERSGYHEED